MSATNYTADRECNPTSVTFANGRRVWLNSEGFLDVGWAEGFPKEEYPKPCELCEKQIESREDLDWHGLGNCVPICERCVGSGIEPDADKIREGYDRAAQGIIQNCVMLIRRLAYKHHNEKLKNQALDYLRGEGLQGSVLRDATAPPAQGAPGTREAQPGNLIDKYVACDCKFDQGHEP